MLFVSTSTNKYLLTSFKSTFLSIIISTFGDSHCNSSVFRDFLTLGSLLSLWVLGAGLLRDLPWGNFFFFLLGTAVIFVTVFSRLRIFVIILKHFYYKYKYPFYRYIIHYRVVKIHTGLNFS